MRAASTFVILATAVLARANPPHPSPRPTHATGVTGCYRFRWADERAGTWDAALPDRIRLSTQPARSDREPVRYEAALRYVWRTSSDSPDEPMLFSNRPTWQLLGVDSLVIDLSGGRPAAAFRYVLRARYDAPEMVGTLGMLSGRGFAPLVAFEARSIECDTGTLRPSERAAVPPNGALPPTSAVRHPAE